MKTSENNDIIPKWKAFRVFFVEFQYDGNILWQFFMFLWSIKEYHIVCQVCFTFNKRMTIFIWLNKYHEEIPSMHANMMLCRVIRIRELNRKLRHINHWFCWIFLCAFNGTTYLKTRKFEFRKISHLLNASS